MDEKELIKDIRWRLSQGKNRAEITRKLQAKGLKLEFIDSLIYRAKKPRKIAQKVFFSIILLFFMWCGVYAMFFYHETEQVQYTPSWISIEQGNSTAEQIYSENFSLEITPELISLVASEIGAGKLRTSPLTLKRPIINFKISEDLFFTTIDKKIKTSEGNSKEADLAFITQKETIERIFSLGKIKEDVKAAVISGEITIEQLSSEKELFLKGYLGLYNELKD